MALRGSTNYVDQLTDDDAPEQYEPVSKQHYRRRTTDLHLLWGKSKTLSADRLARADIPMANYRDHTPWCGDPAFGRPVDRCTCADYPEGFPHGNRNP